MYSQRSLAAENSRNLHVANDAAVSVSLRMKSSLTERHITECVRSDDDRQTTQTAVSFTRELIHRYQHTSEGGGSLGGNLEKCGSQTCDIFSWREQRETAMTVTRVILCFLMIQGAVKGEYQIFTL